MVTMEVVKTAGGGAIGDDGSDRDAALLPHVLACLGILILEIQMPLANDPGVVALLFK